MNSGRVLILGLTCLVFIIWDPPAVSGLPECYKCTGPSCNEPKIGTCGANAVGCVTRFLEDGSLITKHCANPGEAPKEEGCVPFRSPGEDKDGRQCFCAGVNCNDGFPWCYKCSGDECKQPNRLTATCGTKDSKGCFTTIREEGRILAKSCAQPGEEFKASGCIKESESSEGKDVHKCFCIGDRCNDGLNGQVVLKEKPVEKCYVCRRPCEAPYTHNETCPGGYSSACMTEIGPNGKVTSQYCARSDWKEARPGCSPGPDGTRHCACTAESCNADNNQRSGKMANSKTEKSQGLTLRIGLITPLPALWMMVWVLF